MSANARDTAWLYGTDNHPDSQLRKTKRKITVNSAQGAILIDTQNIRGGNRSMIWLSLNDARELADRIIREAKSYDD